MITTTTTSAPLAHIGVGIDTARYGHRVNFLREDQQRAAAAMTITENAEGYQRLSSRLEQLHRKHPQAQFHVHLDAAGQYAANLERFLRSLDLPLILSIGEPKRNKDYHKAFFPKRTSDDTESQAMARFGVIEKPAPTGEVPDEFLALREIASRLQGLVRDTTRATNRLHNLLARVFPELATVVKDLTAGWVMALLKKYPTPQQIAGARLSSLKKIPYIPKEMVPKLRAAARGSVGSFRGQLAQVLIAECAVHLQHCQNSEKRLEKLLLEAYRQLPASAHVHVGSIVGIGEVTAAVLVAKIVSIQRFATPEHLVGYFGVFPEENTSGVDRQGNKIPPGTMRMSPKGCDLVRRYLWNAAKSAMVHNPAVADLYARLRAKGTRGDVALGHCMRKLLHQVFGVWTTNTPYDQKLARARHMTTSQPESTNPPAAAAHSQTETAAGHKRDVVPECKVVTAATSSVESSPTPVNHTADTLAAGSVDYPYLRQQITIEQVLTHLGYSDRLRGSGTERRGPCPLHGSTNPKSRSFSVNLKKHVFKCSDPQCQAQGNALDLWAAAHRLPLYQAALSVAQTFHLQTNRNREEAARNAAHQQRN